LTSLSSAAAFTVWNHDPHPSGQGVDVQAEVALTIQVYILPIQADRYDRGGSELTPRCINLSRARVTASRLRPRSLSDHYLACDELEGDCRQTPQSSVHILETRAAEVISSSQFPWRAALEQSLVQAGEALCRRSASIATADYTAHDLPTMLFHTMYLGAVSVQHELLCCLEVFLFNSFER
jgi:hypothetical protein